MNGNISPPFILSLPIYAKRETPLRACSAKFLICGASTLNHTDSSNNHLKHTSGHFEDDDEDSTTSSIISLATISDNENDLLEDHCDFLDYRTTNDRTIVDHFSLYNRNDDGKFFDDVTFDTEKENGLTVASVAINHCDTQSLLERSKKGYFRLYSDPLFNCDAKATKYILEKRTFFQNYCSPSKSIRTFEGLPVLTFPNRNLIINYSDYKCLLSYLHQNLPYDDTRKGYVLIIDRRLDKWANVKTLLGYISSCTASISLENCKDIIYYLHTTLMNYFPAKIKAIYLVKPNGVLQKALEVGFKRSIDCFNFPLIICNVLEELHCYLNTSLLTNDLQGHFTYNHFEWVRNCVDVERMKASAKNMSESLADFADFLRDGDMYANDASTTKKLIESQKIEHQAIKQDFVSVRRQGYSVLQQVRRVDLQPDSELLAPTRLHHVTTVERLLLQLEDTERSFDNFWSKHEIRLGQKFQLRSFEEEFKKLQTSLSRHISHVEESRQIGNNVDSVNALISKHRIYMEHAEETITISEKLREKGEYLMKQEEVREMAGGSLKPKCEELDRLNELLKQNLENRLFLLRHSKTMHEQIGAANAWCTKGVELLTNLSPLFNKDSESKKHGGNDGSILSCASSENDRIPEKDDSPSPATSSDLLETRSTTRRFIHNFDNTLSLRNHSSLLSCEDLSKRIDDFLTVGHCLKFDSFGRRLSDISQFINEATMEESNVAMNNNGISSAKGQAVTTDTSVLLEQVGARIEDIRRMCESRKIHLQKQYNMCNGPTPPEKQVPAESVVDLSSESSNKDDLPLLTGSESCSDVLPDIVAISSTMDSLPAKITFVLDELLTTEKIYVQDLLEIAEFYSKPFLIEYKNDQNDDIKRIHELIFGNLDEIHEFHSEVFLPQLVQACRQCPRNVAHCFEDSVADLANLYETYCWNKSRGDQCQEMECFQDFFRKSQAKAGHLLPLGAYLLKPIQRITKYQLLLQELAKYCRNREDEYDVSHALQCMLDLLNELNSSFAQIKITGYPVVPRRTSVAAQVGNLTNRMRAIHLELKFLSAHLDACDICSTVISSSKIIEACDRMHPTFIEITLNKKP